MTICSEDSGTIAGVVPRVRQTIVACIVHMYWQEDDEGEEEGDCYVLGGHLEEIEKLPWYQT